MRKIIIILIILLLNLSLILPALAEEKIFPQSDFFLYLGIRNAAAGIGPGKIEKILFSSSHVDMRAGKITADRNIPINYTQGVEDVSGNAHLRMDGDYDKSDGRLSGYFSIVSNVKVVWHGAFDSNTDWVETINGSFSGQVVDEKVIIRYNGKSSTESHEGMADGKVRNRSEVNDYTSVVAWRMNDYKAPEVPVVSEIDKEFLDKDGKPVDSRARFGSRDGQVEIHIPGEPEDVWHIATPITVIPYGARIKTDDDSEAIISFPDHTIFKMKPESTIIISKPPTDNDSKWKLVAGNIWVNVKKVLKDGTMEIDVNQAVAGKKGTTFVASQIGDNSVFKVIEGEMFIKAKNSDETADIVGGQQATIDSTGRIVKENFDIIAEQDTWDKSEKVDFAMLEKALPAESTAELVIQGSRDDKPKNKNIFYIIGGLILIGGIFVGFFKRKKVNIS